MAKLDREILQKLDVIATNVVAAQANTVDHDGAFPRASMDALAAAGRAGVGRAQTWDVTAWIDGVTAVLCVMVRTLITEHFRWSVETRDDRAPQERPLKLAQEPQ